MSESKKFISLFPNRERNNPKSPLLFGIFSEETTKGRKTEKSEWGISLWPLKNKPQEFSGSFAPKGERENAGRISITFLKKVKSESHPVARGVITFDDEATPYEVALWGKVSGKGEKYFSGQWKENEGKEQAGKEDYLKGSQFIDEILDDLPF